MHPWLIPVSYAVISVVCGLGLPRLEDAYLGSYTVNISVTSMQALLSAVASGMMVPTGILFSIAFVVVQFGATAYSPRLVLWFAREPLLYHSIGVFVATVTYSLAMLLWVDRGGSSTVPLFSPSLLVVLLVLSVVLFSRLIQRLNDLQITNVIRIIGSRGREVIREMSQKVDQRAMLEGSAAFNALGSVTQTLRYSGEPRTITRVDIDILVEQANQAVGVIVLACGVGDTLIEDTVILRLHGAKKPLIEMQLMKAIHLGAAPTFELDPKYPLRLLVDIAIRALSPANNDPTTAVQALDQIEDLLIRLGRRKLETGYFSDANGVLRFVLPMPTWEDYLALAFDEIRQNGRASVQVLRRLRAALTALADAFLSGDRVDEVRRHLKQLDLTIARSSLDPEDQARARETDRQGLGLARKAICVRSPVSSIVRPVQ
jgi:uncharacterized membrane protein